MTYYWILTLAVFLEVAGDVCFRQHALIGRGFSTGVLAYVLSSCVWGISLRYTTLSQGVVVFTMLNLILAVGAGMTLFDERLSAAQWLGVGLAVVSIVLVGE